MSVPEIVVPVTEPETEWVRGRPLQKMSPTRSHALVQLAFASALRAWAGNRGDVGTEWRFRIEPPGEPVRPLVPDVAYVALERLRGLRGRDLEVPQLAPDVVIEVLSPDDERSDVDDKIATYLAAGTTLVIIADPRTSTVELHDHEFEQLLGVGETIAHAGFPGFRLTVEELFAGTAAP
jgi:Uma2 family endonuclease